MIEVLAGVLILLGGGFAVIAGLGVVRLPDVLIRMHASTKVGTLSSGLIIAGAAIHFGSAHVIAVCVAMVIFLLLTAPIGAHMIGRAAIRTAVPLWHPDNPSKAEPETAATPPDHPSAG